MDEQEVSKGLFEFADGGRYVGEWGCDGAHGYGVCSLPSEGGVFEGRWDCGNQISGIFSWSSGQKYIGTWENGMRNGQGKEIKPDGTEYIGEFRDNIRGQYGVLKLANGALYRGTWDNGLQDGIGVEIYVDKGVYKGQYKKGQREGYGTRSSAAYEIYSNSPTIATESVPNQSSASPRPKSSITLTRWMSSSDWKQNRDSNVQIYEGQWKADKREGYGILKVPNKYTYFGEWKNNMRAGYGAIVYDDGSKEEGIWENGHLVTPLKRKKLSLKHHQIENKVKQSHTTALQVADIARNKSVLAESRASAAISKSKSALKLIGAAMNDAEIARNLSQSLKPQSKSILSGTTPNVHQLPQDYTPSHLSLTESLAVPSISPSPSLEAVASIDYDGHLLSSSSESLESEILNNVNIPVGNDDTISSYSDTGILIKVDDDNDTGVLRKRKFSKQAKSIDIVSSESPQIRKRSMSDDFVLNRAVLTSHSNRVSSRFNRIPRIDKSTGELTNSADNTDDELNDHHDIANRVTHSMSVVQPSPLQNNTQMANWNKMFACINFALLILLLLLIVIMMAVMSSTITFNNPTSFMTHMA